MKVIAELIKKKMPNYAHFALCAFSMPYNHQWNKNKYVNWDKELSENQFSKLKKSYSDRPLERQMIINLFAEGKLYDGFLCAMIWGSIGNNIKGKETFKSIFEKDHHQKIENVVNLLWQDGLKEAYKSLDSGDSKIENVGESFFTKLLYFAGAHMTNLNPQPLILDSNMHLVYKHIRSDISNDPIEMYVDYCNEMEELRRHLVLPTAGHVEALLFCPGIRDLIFDNK